MSGMVMTMWLTAVVFIVPSVDGFFRLNCLSTLLAVREDPIVSPGVISQSVNSISGASKFSATATSSDLAVSNCSTCLVYWIPDLYYLHRNGSFERVESASSGLLIYYLQRPNTVGNLMMHGIPAGLRIVAGNPFLRTWQNTPEQQAITFACVDSSSESLVSTYALPPYNCPGSLRLQVFLPSCW